VGNDKLDSQVAARLLKRAQAIKGSRERLAEALEVHPHDLAHWIAGKAFPPQRIVEKVLEIVLDAHDAHSDRQSADSTEAKGRKPRALIAESPAGVQAISRMLGDGLELLPVHTLTEALDLVQGSAVFKSGSINVIICGQHFEGSQMLRFLECVKAYEPTSRIPFICCRLQDTKLSEGSLAAMRDACEALGAVAYIDLPSSEKKAGAEAAAVDFRDAVRAAVQAPTQQPLRVLVADDNADAAHTLSALLRMAGHEVHKANSGSEALALAFEMRPAVVVLDLGMPGISGYAVAERIRAESWGGAVTLIALTGYGGLEDLARASKAGFDHHFLKPATVEDLLRVFPK
jgi:CheY-like chemotaxis protein